MRHSLAVIQLIGKVNFGSMQCMSKKKKILVAEDDRFLLKVYSTKLEQAGYAVITSNDGVEALRKAHEVKPDLMLIDMIMPKKNGFDVLLELKGDPETANIPVIILSSLGQETDVERGLQIGAADYLIKSNASFKDVKEKIEQFIK